MEYLFVIVSALALWHYVYESAIASSLRSILRYELFKHRDDLRRLRANQEVSKEDFNAIDRYLNTTIYLLNSYDIIMLYRINKKVRNNEKLQAEMKAIEAKHDLMDERLKAIKKKAISSAAKATYINNGGWAIYLLPLVLIVAVCALVFASMKSVFRSTDKLLESGTYAPEKFNIEVHKESYSTKYDKEYEFA